jgi:flagellar motor switch protein FliM
MQDHGLDQSAIDSLFTRAKTVETAEAVNFADRKSITAEQMLMLVSMNQAFSRTLSIKLSAWLGASIKVSMVAAERCLYQDLLETIDVEASYFAQCRFRSPDCRALFVMDMALTEPVVNLGLGGLAEIPGDGVQREVTLIDTAVVNIMLTTISSEMNHMWIACGLHADFESEVPQANSARFFSRGENVLSFIYEMTIGKVQGTFQIAFATAASDVILREIERQDSRRVQSPATRQMLEQRLAEVMQPATLRLPAFRLRAAELMRLEPGSVLKSTLARSSPFRFAVEGGPSWEATAVVVDSRVSARLGAMQTGAGQTGAMQTESPSA